MNYSDATRQIADYRQQIAALRAKVREARVATEPQEVQDYEFQTPGALIRLSQLFGTHELLIVIHNMGASCPACTMWADGYNGLHRHVTTRAAFVVSSPDPPELQKRFAVSRGWTFPMVSHAGSTFAADMGYRSAKGWRPGVSVFQRRANGIFRVSDAGFNAGDDFCATYHFLDLLPEGVAGWCPKLSYGPSSEGE